MAGLGLVLWGAGLAWISYCGQNDPRAEWEQPRDGPADGIGYQPRIVSRLSFPALDRALYVFDGALEENLLLGPIHVVGSAEPGQAGNCVIAGHRDTHFRILKNVKPGDQINIEHEGRTFSYRVVSAAIIGSSDDRFYRPTANPVLTLVTCYPFYYVGAAPKRYILRAQLIES